MRAGDVRDLGDGHVLARSGRNFCDGARHAGRAALGNHHAVRAGRVGRAQDRAQIVRIFHAIEHDDQRIFRALGGDHIFEIVVLFGRRDGDHALMRRVARQFVEFGALQETHVHAESPAIFNQALQADVVALLGHADPLKRPPARLQRLGNGIDAVDVVHEYSVYRKRGRAAL